MSDRKSLAHIATPLTPAFWRRIASSALLTLPLLTLPAALRPPQEEIDPAVIDALARTMSQELDQGDHFDAQVWLLSSAPKLARYVTVEQEQELILRTVYREALRHKID